MRRIIYTSHVARRVRYQDAEAIALDASVRNEREGVTGLLLYTPSHFIQVLEGNAPAVDAVLARIQRDPRHSHVRVIDDREVDEREFTQWAMHAKACSSKAAELEQIDLERALELLRAQR
jgi:hypothetical protein